MATATAASEAGILRLITTDQLDRRAVADALAELTRLVESGRVTGLVFALRYIDPATGEECTITEHPGLDGFAAVALHEFAKSAIFEDAWRPE